MSRGFGRWQRVILLFLKENPQGLLAIILAQHLDRKPSRAEYSAFCRAARSLAQRGGCVLERVSLGMPYRHTGYYTEPSPNAPFSAHAWINDDGSTYHYRWWHGSAIIVRRAS